MSEFIEVTPKGKRLIASKFGIPYGLFLAIYSHYALWIIFPAIIMVDIAFNSFWSAWLVSMSLVYSWYLAYLYMHPTKEKP